MRHRVNLRLFSGLWIVVLVGLLLAVDSIAAPGGGSSGFGGGGGGGGGGGFSGGGSGSGDGEGSPWVFLIAVVIGLTAVRLRPRSRRTACASGAASAPRASSSPLPRRPATTRTSPPTPSSAEAAALHRRIVAAWTARDRDALARDLGPDLLAEWVRRLDDFDRKGWHNVCEIRKPPEVEYLGLTNREDDAEDRVVVRVTAELRDVVIDRDGKVIKRNEEDDELTTLAEYWTLGPPRRRLDPRTRSSRTPRARTTSTRRSSPRRGPTTPACTTRRSPSSRSPTPCPDGDIAGLVDVDYAGDARTQALDLSVVDGRFAPAVLEAAARRAVEAWAEAVDGADTALERAATPEAAHALLYPRGEEHPARGPRPEARAAPDRRRSTPTRARSRSRPSSSGRRYLEDRDTAAVLEGSKDRATTFTERWTLALGDDPATPWRIVATAPVG